MKWMNYDLHMHSNKSGEKKSGDKSRVTKMQPSVFVSILLNKGIDVFSITDHNSIDANYYVEIQKYIIDSKFEIKLLMGAELDVSIELLDGTLPYINVLFYFKEHYQGIDSVISELYKTSKPPSIKTIIDTFNSKRYNYIVVPEGRGDKGIASFISKMSPEDSRIFNINGMYKIFGGFDKTISETFNAELWALGFYEKSIELSKLIESYSGDVNELIDSIVLHLKKGTSLSTQLEIDIANGIKKYSSFIARFKFSDWHNKEPYDAKYFNHIFGDESKPFESFELALIDPESRLVVNNEKLIIENNSFIKKIEFKLNGIKKDILFTEGLNVIIGERGSGKSLLHTIIKSLKFGADELKKYVKQYKIIDLKVTLVNNQTITHETPFDSIEVIDQMDIEKYFEHNLNLEKHLDSNFKELDEVDLTVIDKVIQLSRNIIPKRNFIDNISPIINNIVETDGYILSSKEQKNYHRETKEKYELFKKYLNDFCIDLKEKGYNTSKLCESARKVIYDSELLVSKSSILNEFKQESKNIIDNEIVSSKDNLNRTQNSYQLIDEYLARANDYFDVFLNNHKMNYLVNNLRIKKPKSSIVWHNLGYIFVRTSELENTENINDDLKSTIVNCVYRGNNREFKTQIEGVLSGNNRFNKDKVLEIELDKYKKSLSVGTKTHLYKCIDSIHLSNAEVSLDNFNELIKNNMIESVTEGSLGMKTAAYLDFAFESKNEILLFDQPEDNIDNMYISSRLVKLIKDKKKTKQMIFVTHNPSLAVYSDAFNYIVANKEVDKINYVTIEITDKINKDKILEILDGGKYSFSNRNMKYGNVIGGIDYED